MTYAELINRLSMKGYATFDTTLEFLAACSNYFKWAEENPLQEEKVSFHQGMICRADQDKVRVFTKRGLCLYINIPYSRLASYKQRSDDWREAVEAIETVIYDQKKTNAYAGLINATMAVRDLGMSEKTEVEQTATVTTTHTVAEEHMAIHLHPEDPDPMGYQSGVFPRPMYSQAQLNAGIKFSLPD